MSTATIFWNFIRIQGCNSGEKNGKIYLKMSKNIYNVTLKMTDTENPYCQKNIKCLCSV